jgi:cytochrome c oxidase subunit 3
MAATDVSEAADHDDEGHAEHEHRSKWPIVAAVGAGALYFGAGMWFVGADLVPAPLSLGLVAVGVLGLLAGLVGWTYEAFLANYMAGHGMGTGESTYVGGMILFLVSDVATFAAGFVYYAFIRVGQWPPEELPSLLGSLVLVNTLLLVASSFTLHYAHESLEEGDRRRFLGLLGVTLALGVVFLGGQAYEYYEFVTAESFTLTSGLFASAFYGLTGLHGLHVTLGVVLIGLTMGRALRGQFGPDRDTSVRTVSLYWHFVDVVWVFLVVVLYVGASPKLF